MMASTTRIIVGVLFGFLGLLNLFTGHVGIAIIVFVAGFLLVREI